MKFIVTSNPLGEYDVRLNPETKRKIKHTAICAFVGVSVVAGFVREYNKDDNNKTPND